MDKFVTKMERRINYLTSESRRMFGLLAEKKYVLYNWKLAGNVICHMLTYTDNISFVFK